MTPPTSRRDKRIRPLAGRKLGILPSDFPNEKEMVSFFAENLHLIEPGMRLFTETGGTGVQLPCRTNDRGSTGHIDLCTIDRNGAIVVIEVKLRNGEAAALGQLIGYMAWARKMIAYGRRVRGVILVQRAGPMLKLALAESPKLDVEVVEIHDYLLVP